MGGGGGACGIAYYRDDTMSMWTTLTSNLLGEGGVCSQQQGCVDAGLYISVENHFASE